MRYETKPAATAELTVPALLRHAAAHWGDQEAVVDEDQRLTFTQLHNLVEHGAQALRAYGLEHGGTVAIWAPNSAEWVTVALSVLAAGGIVVPLSSRLRGFEVAEALADSHTTMLVLHHEAIGKNFTRMLDEALRENEHNWSGQTIYLDHDQCPPPSGARTTWRALLDKTELASDASPAVVPEQTADILFTSGTTGRPKGVAMTHHQVVELALSWARQVEVGSGDRYLILSPLSHTFGYKTGMLVCLASGATMVTAPTAEPALVTKILTRERITILPGVPTALSDLMSSPSLADPDDLYVRVVVTGGAPCAPELIDDMRRRFGAAAVVSAYGLTEAGPVTMCGLYERGDDVARTTGRPLDGVTVKIRGNDNRPAAPGEAGEIYVRSPFLMQGYWDVISQSPALDLDDGWLATGDIGVVDKRGYLTIVDRLKDVIQVGGFSVYPAEVERVLRTHPGVFDAAVLGLADTRLGEIPVAYVVPATRTSADQDLIDHCRRRLANFKVPRYVHFVEDLPRNATGKVLRNQLCTTHASDGGNHDQA